MIHPTTQKLVNLDKSSYLPLERVAELLEVDILTMREHLERHRDLKTYQVKGLRDLILVPIPTLKGIFETLNNETAIQVMADIRAANCKRRFHSGISK